MRFLGVCFGFIFLLSLSGCATMRKNDSMEMQGLKNQVSVLESQLKIKDDESATLQDSLRVKESKSATPALRRNIGEVKSRPTMRQIQQSLKNAGYSPGSVDGVSGRKTREAIKAFQRDNKITPDGRAGKKTWELLKEYLDKKSK